MTASPIRTPLPTRRPSATFSLDWSGQRATVTFGYDTAGAVREVFADVAREGSDIQRLLSDWCVMVSLALQHGISPAALSHSLARVPDPMQGEDARSPASLIGAIMDVMMQEPAQ